MAASVSLPPLCMKFVGLCKDTPEDEIYKKFQLPIVIEELRTVRPSFSPSNSSTPAPSLHLLDDSRVQRPSQVHRKVRAKRRRHSEQRAEAHVAKAVHATSSLAGFDRTPI